MTFSPDDIKQYDDVLYEDVRASVFKFLKSPGWESGWKSNSKTDTFSFMHKHFAGYRKSESSERYDCADELKTNAPLIFGMWEHVSDAYLQGHRLVRCYANGMPYGSDGSLHIDDKTGNGYTSVYYPNETWSPNWGGCTEFYDQPETNVIRSIDPQPNRMIVFPGKMKHVGRGIARQCPVPMRITLMFKTDIAKNIPKDIPEWEPDPLDIATEAHSPPQWIG